MASGKRWQDWVERACACPSSFPFGTKVILDGKEWVCMDRGGKIEYVDGIPWIDFLTQHPKHNYGDIMEARVDYP